MHRAPAARAWRASPSRTMTASIPSAQRLPIDLGLLAVESAMSAYAATTSRLLRKLEKWSAIFSARTRASGKPIEMLRLRGIQSPERGSRDEGRQRWECLRFNDLNATSPGKSVSGAVFSRR